jgi:hypothetical protein
MTKIEIGSEVEVDLFGLQLSGAALTQRAIATVIGFRPGIIIVRVDLPGRGPTEVAVSAGRICR